jgi:8-oxo-dGTP pyrophosphatase MutT (NUDIX family)
LLAGLAWGEIGRHVKACFGVAALMGSDGAFIVGQMAPHTRNAGQLYFPSGSFDRKDVTAGKLDVLASIFRELREETGLAPGDLAPDPGWHAVFAGPRVPLFKLVRASEPADVVRRRIVTNLAAQKKPEFVAIEVVRSGDVDPRMPLWMRAFLRHASDVFG